MAASGSEYERDSKLLVAALDEMVLSRQPALTTQRKVRSSLMQPSGGLTFAQALARAQARVDTSSNETITAQGELDAMRYGGILQARSLVGVRWRRHDIRWQILRQECRTPLQPGSYTQSFTLTRQGTGSASPVVTP